MNPEVYHLNYLVQIDFSETHYELGTLEGHYIVETLHETGPAATKPWDGEIELEREMLRWSVPPVCHEKVWKWRDVNITYCFNWWAR